MRPTVGKEIRKIIRELLVEEIASINKESVSLDQKTTSEVIVSIRTDVLIFLKNKISLYGSRAYIASVFSLAGSRF